MITATYSLGAWAWTIGLTGAVLRFTSGHRSAVRYVADSSYWIYIVHLPVMASFQTLVYPFTAPAIVKYGVVVAASLLVLFASYHMFVRHSWIGRWLKFSSNSAGSGSSTNWH